MSVVAAQMDMPTCMSCCRMTRACPSLLVIAKIQQAREAQQVARSGLLRMPMAIRAGEEA